MSSVSITLLCVFSSAICAYLGWKLGCAASLDSLTRIANLTKKLIAMGNTPLAIKLLNALAHAETKKDLNNKLADMDK